MVCTYVWTQGKAAHVHVWAALHPDFTASALRSILRAHCLQLKRVQQLPVPSSNSPRPRACACLTESSCCPGLATSGYTGRSHLGLRTLPFLRGLLLDRTQELWETPKQSDQLGTAADTPTSQELARYLRLQKFPPPNSSTTDSIAPLGAGGTSPRPYPQ